MQNKNYMLYTHGEYFVRIARKRINILIVTIYFHEKTDILKPDQRPGSKESGDMERRNEYGTY